MKTFKIKDIYGKVHEFLTRKTMNYFIKTHPELFTPLKY